MMFSSILSAKEKVNKILIPYLRFKTRLVWSGLDSPGIQAKYWQLKVVP